MNRPAENGRSKSQTARIVELLAAKRGQWIPLPEILGLGIAQYSARIHTARHELGLRIENRTEGIEGVRHSWFRLPWEQKRLTREGQEAVLNG
jgi:hypothetical protein